MNPKKINSLLENVYQYIDTKFKLTTLEAEKKLTNAAEEKLTRASVLLLELLLALTMISVFFLYAGLALAFYINDLIGNGKEYTGFLIVGIGHLVLLAIILISRRVITKKLRNRVKKIVNRVIIEIFFK